MATARAAAVFAGGSVASPEGAASVWRLNLILVQPDGSEVAQAPQFGQDMA